MSAITPSHAEALPVERDHLAVGWWGMILFVLTEATLFAMLLGAYFYLRAGSRVWPPDGIKPPDLIRPSIMTALLLVSAASMVWADRGIVRDRRGPLVAGLAATFALGVAFLVLDGIDLTSQTFAAQTDAYGSLYFAINSIDGIHVLAGVALLLYVELRAALGHFRAGRSLAVQNTALFWYFIVGVWVAIFISLDLSPWFLKGVG